MAVAGLSIAVASAGLSAVGANADAFLVIFLPNDMPQLFAKFANVVVAVKAGLSAALTVRLCAGMTVLVEASDAGANGEVRGVW